ncbi:MAG: helix-turn-helix domain-containing protein [Ardenticatenaceae bacterium]
MTTLLLVAGKQACEKDPLAKLIAAPGENTRLVQAHSEREALRTIRQEKPHAIVYVGNDYSVFVSKASRYTTVPVIELVDNMLDRDALEDILNQSPFVEWKSLTLDNRSLEAEAPYFEKVRLPRKQFLLCKKLVEAAGEVVTREDLCDVAKITTTQSDPLSVHILELRKAIHPPQTKRGIFVEVKRGAGYYLEEVS